MSRTYRQGGWNVQNAGTRRNRSYRKLGRAVIYLANAQQEQEAKLECRKQTILEPRRHQTREKIRL